MKLSDIIKQANRDIDDAFNSADIIDWVNRCLDDLTPIAYKEAKQSYTINSTNNYSLPSDLHLVFDMQVTDSTNNNIYTFDQIAQNELKRPGYKTWAGQFSLQCGPTAGTIDLYYYGKLNHVVNPDDVPEIDSQFHDLFILYASAMSQFFDERPDKEADLMQRYITRKHDFEQFMLNRQMSDDVLDEVW